MDEDASRQDPDEAAARALDAELQQDPLFTAPLPAPAALLRAARHYADLSQRELAVRAGVGKSVVGDIESGRVAKPTFALMVRLVAATGLQVRVIDQLAMPVTARPLDRALNGGGRHWPGHLDVTAVRSDRDWWHGRMLPGARPLPEYTAEWRRARAKARVRRRKGETLEQARARARARNTPPEPEVTGGDRAAG